jgi:hypothetical protein
MYGIGLIDIVNQRAIALEELAEARATAFDFYVFTRDAYLQNRAYRVRGETAPPAETYDDLYEFDDLEDDEEPLDAAAADVSPQEDDASPPKDAYHYLPDLQGP